MRAAFVAAVRLYQIIGRPLRPPCCRFTPECSDYAIEAFHRHGALRGLALTLRRLSRCHPFGAAGYDPVPAVVEKPGMSVYMSQRPHGGAE